MNHMIKSFELIYNRLNSNGIYMVEDTHTCYLSKYGGGLRKPGTFIEFAKKKLDELNAIHTNGEVDVSEFTRSTSSINFYDGMVVFERKLQGIRNDLFTDVMRLNDDSVIKSFLGKTNFNDQKFRFSTLHHKKPG